MYVCRIVSEQVQLQFAEEFESEPARNTGKKYWMGRAILNCKCLSHKLTE